VDRDAAAATEVRLDSTFAGFDGRRAVPFGLGLTPFLESFRDAAFAGFAFKLMDLTGADARRAGFLVALDFGFVFVAISPGTYTGYAI
jgi:hypothetical protein